MSEILSYEIAKEICNAPFASAIVHEATDLSNSSQLSVSIRVVVEGKGVFERICEANKCQ